MPAQIRYAFRDVFLASVCLCLFGQTSFGQSCLEESNAIGAGDKERHGKEALCDDVDVRFDADAA